MVIDIIVCVIAIAILILTIFRFIRTKFPYLIIELVVELVGLISLFICLGKGDLKLLGLYITSIILAIVIPIIFYLIEKWVINLNDLYYLIKAKKNKENYKEILIKGLDKNPNSFILNKRLAKYYFENKEFEKAEDIYLKLIDLKPNDINLHVEIANMLYEGENTKQSVELLRMTLDKKPGCLEASKLLGTILYETGECKEAINVLNVALQNNPSCYDLYYMLGMTYTKLNDFNSAEKYYKKAATINGYKDLANLNLGQIELIFRDYDAAEEYFMKTIDCDDDVITANAYLNIAKVKMIRRNIPQAIQYAELAVEIYPKIINKFEKDDTLRIILPKVKMDRAKKNKVVNTKVTETQQETIDHLGKTFEKVEKLTESIPVEEREMEEDEQEQQNELNKK